MVVSLRHCGSTRNSRREILQLREGRERSRWGSTSRSSEQPWGGKRRQASPRHPRLRRTRRLGAKDGRRPPRPSPGRAVRSRRAMRAVRRAVRSRDRGEGRADPTKREGAAELECLSPIPRKRWRARAGPCSAVGGRRGSPPAGRNRQAPGNREHVFALDDADHRLQGSRAACADGKSISEKVAASKPH